MLGKRVFGYRPGLCWILAAMVSVAGGLARADELSLSLTGMLAFVETGGKELDVLMVNEYDQPHDPKHRVTHRPLLEISCDDLVDTSQAADCAFWPPARFGGRREIALDSGVSIRLRFQGAPPSGEVGRDTDFKRLISLATAAGSFGEASLVRSEVSDPATARDHVLARFHLAGGKLSVTKSKTGSWQFKDAAGSDVSKFAEVGDIANWSAQLEWGAGVTLELWPFGATSAARAFKLHSAQGKLGIVLSNEPDPAEFCFHAPKDSKTAFAHFLGFWDLSKYARLSPGALNKLPMPYVDDPAQLCPSGPMPITGRRVDCMMVLFKGYE